MSIQAMSWVLTHSPSHGCTRLVMISIANHAGDDGTAYPGIATIAKEANVDQKTVKRCLATLEDDGEVIRVVNGAPDERIPRDKRPNLYAIVGLSGGDNQYPPRGGQPVPRGGDNPSRAGGTTRTPKPSVEPSIEPSLVESASAASPSESKKVDYDGSGDPPSVEAVRLKRLPFPPQFAECWNLYPKRCDHDKLGAYKAWRARVVEAPKAGVGRPERMGNLLWAVRGYVLDCEEEDRAEGFMKNASTFFGAANESVMKYCARLARQRYADPDEPEVEVREPVRARVPLSVVGTAS